MGKEELEIVASIFNSPVIQLVVICIPLYIVWQIFKTIRVKDITPSLTSLVSDLIKERQERETDRKQELEYKQHVNEALEAITSAVKMSQDEIIQSREAIQSQEQTIITHTATVRENVESVNLMHEKLDALQQQMITVESLLNLIKDGTPMAGDDRRAIEEKLDHISSAVTELVSQVAALQKTETEVPTQKIDAIPQPEIETDEAPVTVPKALHGVPITPKPEAKPKEASQ